MTDWFTMLDAAPRRFALALFALATSAATIHCSTGRDGFQPGPNDDAAAPAIGSFTDAASSEGDALPPISHCADENKLIYALSSKENELYRFDPVALTFTSIGKLRCPTSSDTFSMAVDRGGTAWVEYGDGRIFNVSTKDATCTPTAYRPGQYDFTTFGMGFAKDDNEAGAPLTESLYIAGNSLGRLDLTTFEISLVGKASHGQGELAGTAAGTLYGFLSTGNRIVRLDKTSGEVVETYRPDVDLGTGFAIAQWGGDFWLFTAPRNSRTTVTRYSPATDTSTVMIEDTGMLIVGAGSSTCAPAEPPR